MAHCTGCGKSDHKCGYDEDNPVEEDGTYANGAFVCNECYMQLIDVGLDIGPADVVQDRARNLVGGGR